ncbi:unnamed protein product [Alternaria alternata]
MPRAESYQRRPGVKERQPDTYIRVKYLKIDETDWLTRKYYKRQLLFKACKAQKKNPKTKSPLTSEDFEAYPWLFPKDKGMEMQHNMETKKRHGKGKKKQDEEMDIDTEHKSDDGEDAA